MAKNLTIGLLTHLVSGATDFEDNIWKGAYDCAREREVNFICFPGDSISLNPEKKYSNPRNIIFDYISSKRLDGIIFSSTSLSNYISKDDYRDFLLKFKNIPSVSIGKPPLDIPMSLVDNKIGMKKIISHLIDSHNRKNIAFITGPLDNPDAIERFQAYKEVLEEKGITYRDDLIFNGLFIEESGRLAVKHFLKNRVNFDSIVASNDQMAFGALEILHENGIKIPEDVSLAGFDDTLTAQFSNPPLSTVKQPVYKQSYMAAKMLIDLLEGKPFDSINILETELVLRTSCGCFPEELKILDEIVEINNQNTSSIKEQLLSSLKNLTLKYEEKISLIEKLLYDIENEKNTFINFFSNMINEIILKKSNINELSLLLSKVEVVLANFYEQKKFSKIISKARIILSEGLLRYQSELCLNTNKANETLRSSIFSISGNFELKDFLENLSRSLNTLNIPSGFIMLKTGEKLSFLFAYNKEKGLIKSEAKIIDKEEILPQDIWPDKNFGFFIFPILFRNEHLGLLILQIGNMYSFIYESLFYQISSSLKGAMLFERNKRIETELTEKNQRLEALVIPMINSIEEISGILKEKEKSLGQLKETSKETFEELTKTNELLTNISNYANKINEIINIIDDISMTVNLVALNASIESTHAGEYGKGFAIIAREIKKLSDSTKTNAEEIAKTLKTVIQNVNESLSAGKKTSETFKYQEESILELLNALQTVADGVKKLSIASKEILEVMK
ncbi:MAG: substrate-binding domain-containing protein [Brevinematales bacterium]|nr:substrate-binding domain-containing protein [Brevinematales bacterium]